MSLLVRHNPHRSHASLPSLFDRFFDEPFSLFGLPSFQGRPPNGELSAGFRPAVELRETETSYEIRAEVPGIKKDELTIEVKDGALILSGEKKNEHEEKHDGYYRSEVRYGSFRRAFHLGDGVDAENIDAHDEDGVLEVSVPKIKEERRKVSIK